MSHGSSDIGLGNTRNGLHLRSTSHSKPSILHWHATAGANVAPKLLGWIWVYHADLRTSAPRITSPQIPCTHQIPCIALETLGSVGDRRPLCCGLLDDWNCGPWGNFHTAVSTRSLLSREMKWRLRTHSLIRYLSTGIISTECLNGSPWFRGRQTRTSLELSDRNITHGICGYRSWHQEYTSRL